MPSPSASPSPRDPDHTPSPSNASSDTAEEVFASAKMLSTIDKALNHPKKKLNRPKKQETSNELDKLISQLSQDLFLESPLSWDFTLASASQSTQDAPKRAEDELPLGLGYPKTSASQSTRDALKRAEKSSAEPPKPSINTRLETQTAITYDEPLPKDYDTKDDNAPHVLAMRNHPAISQKYHIIRELGHGAQGTTWLAKLKTTNRYVAIKALNFENITQWKSIELFKREIETLRSMRIKGTPQYIDDIDATTCDQPYYFLVQTLVPGKTLEDLLHEGNLFSPDNIVNIALAILPILNKMHMSVPPIIHRDIKPSNIMLTQGNIFLIDFGASMLHEHALGGTTVVGTIGYMAPEQCMGSSGPASDIYSLGATLVHLLTGKPPYQLPPTKDTRLPFNFKDDLPPDTPPQLSQLLEAMLTVDPENRLTNLTLLIHLLNEYKKKKAKFSFLPEPLFKYSFSIHISWFIFLLFLASLSAGQNKFFLPDIAFIHSMILLCFIGNIALFFVHAYFYQKPKGSKSLNEKMFKTASDY